MINRVLFLDIDGPIIPFGMFLVDRMASANRIIPQIPVAVVREVCVRAKMKVVFNSTHNTPFVGVPNIDDAMVAAGLPRDAIHPDKMTRYPSLSRADAVRDWLHRHPEVNEWVAFDDARFTDDDNLIWVDPDAGLHLAHLNIVLERFNSPQFLVL